MQMKNFSESDIYNMFDKWRVQGNKNKVPSGVDFENMFNELYQMGYAACKKDLATAPDDVDYSYMYMGMP